MVIYGLQAWELIAGKEKRKMLRMLAPKDARMASIYSKMAKARELHKMYLRCKVLDYIIMTNLVS
jgi:hypothetical protein